MALDVVYPLSKGSTWNDNELRYSIRSLEQYLSGVGEIYIIGHRPEWIKNVNHIPAGDPYKCPDKNIWHKISLLEGRPALMVHDDHYLLTPFHADIFPYFYSDTIENYLKTRTGGHYKNRTKNSLDFLQSKGLPTKFFDVHTPIPLRHPLPKFPLDNFIFKSIYANSYYKEGTQLADNKGDIPPKHGLIFSSMPVVKKSVREWLQDSFPNKSWYE